MDSGVARLFRPMSSTLAQSTHWRSTNHLQRGRFQIVWSDSVAKQCPQLSETKDSTRLSQWNLLAPTDTLLQVTPLSSSVTPALTRRSISSESLWATANFANLEILVRTPTSVSTPQIVHGGSRFTSAYLVDPSYITNSSLFLPPSLQTLFTFLTVNGISHKVNDVLYRCFHRFERCS